MSPRTRTFSRVGDATAPANDVAGCQKLQPRQDVLAYVPAVEAVSRAPLPLAAPSKRQEASNAPVTMMMTPGGSNRRADAIHDLTVGRHLSPHDKQIWTEDL